jgi:hypothetical protein
MVGINGAECWAEALLDHAERSRTRLARRRHGQPERRTNARVASPQYGNGLGWVLAGEQIAGRAHRLLTPRCQEHPRIIDA